MNILRTIARKSLRLIAATALTFSALTAAAGIIGELPTIRVNGQVMYYYDAQSGDNIYSIAEKLGVTPEQIRSFNPSAADGIKPRMRLFFPSDFAPEGTGDSLAPLSHVVKKNESVYGIARTYGMTMDELLQLNPNAADGIRPGMRLRLKDTPAAEAMREQAAVEPSADASSSASAIAALSAAGDSADATADVVADDAMAECSLPVDSVASAPDKTMNVAIMLPFLLEESTMGRQTQYVTEFYKGFLIAADTLNRPGEVPVKIYAYDTAANADTVAALMRRPEMAQMDLFVVPDNALQLATISRMAPRNAWIYNVFAVKDSSYVTNPQIIQTNIPHDEMYARAIEGFLDKYTGATPVFLQRKNGRQDKEEFTAALRETLSSKGIIYRTVNFDGYLSDADLEEFPADGGQWVFIPQSGNRDEFARIAPALKALRATAVDPSAVQTFGYPEWATFRGNQLDDLGELQATIYSRYAPVEGDFDARRVNESFRTHYGEGMGDKQLPVLGILGYDSGKMIIEGLRNMSRTGFFPSDYSGIQSGMRLLQAPDNGGLFNNALYIITFYPGGTIEKNLR